MKLWRLSTVLGTAAAAYIIAACNPDSSAPRTSVPPPNTFTASPHQHLMLLKGHLRAAPLPPRRHSVSYCQERTNLLVHNSYATDACL